MRRRWIDSSTEKWVWFGLCSSICLIGVRNASGDVTDDGVPGGMVAYVSGGTCPAGWIAASNVEGRMVVAAIDGQNVGVQVGTPLGDQEDRVHSHDYSGNVALTPKSIAGADGANQEGAKAQSYVLSGTTIEGPSGLPFVQVMTCIKQ